jgi:hypothetical protein
LYHRESQVVDEQSDALWPIFKSVPLTIANPDWVRSQQFRGEPERRGSDVVGGLVEAPSPVQGRPVVEERFHDAVKPSSLPEVNVTPEANEQVALDLLGRHLKSTHVLTEIAVFHPVAGQRVEEALLALLNWAAV